MALDIGNVSTGNLSDVENKNYLKGMLEAKLAKFRYPICIS